MTRSRNRYRNVVNWSTHDYDAPNGCLWGLWRLRNRTIYEYLQTYENSDELIEVFNTKDKAINAATATRKHKSYYIWWLCSTCRTSNRIMPCCKQYRSNL